MAASLGTLHFAAVLSEQMEPWQQGGNQHIPLTEWQQPKDKKASFSEVKILQWSLTSQSTSSLENYFICSQVFIK
jgi:hypothetical protein